VSHLRHGIRRLRKRCRLQWQLITVFPEILLQFHSIQPIWNAT
jgi:hypothetical protein